MATPRQRISSESEVVLGWSSDRRRLPVGVWVVALVVVMGLLFVADRYGFHRDELYFVAAGRRLAWGYVDQPALTPLLARLGDVLPGGVSPLSLRVISALSAGAVVVVSALMTRRFGGGKTAMVLASVFTAGSGFFLAVGHILSTATIDILIWAAVLLVVARLLDGADPRWWLGVGVLVGVGFNNKHTVVALVAALAVGILATPQRSVLASRWPWLGGVVALVLAAPNLAWQAANGWPQLEMTASLRQAADGPADYMLLQVAVLSAFLVVPAAGGFRWLWSDQVGRRWRAFPIAFVLLLVGFALIGGKGYYAAPLYIPLFAAGGVWVAGLTSGWKTTVISMSAVGIVITLFLSLPLLPPDNIDIPNQVNKELGETYGWGQFVDQVASVYETLSEDDRAGAVVFTANYGQAAAIEVLGAGRLPRPVSGHNNYWLWGPPDDGHGPIVMVGKPVSVMAALCPNLEQRATVENAAGVDNDEQGTPIWLCTNPTASLGSIWNELQHFD